MDLRPEGMEGAIDGVNEWVQPHINDGVYRCGFATKQEAYETAFGCVPRATRSTILWSAEEPTADLDLIDAEMRGWAFPVSSYSGVQTPATLHW